VIHANYRDGDDFRSLRDRYGNLLALPLMTHVSFLARREPKTARRLSQASGSINTEHDDPS
jgi:hypothetical protein